MIEIRDLVKGYEKGKPILKGIHVTIADASVFGLVGINGAGKSTLLRLIAGVLQKERGQVRVDGEEVYENERIKQQIFFLPDDPYYTSLSTANDLAKMYKAAYNFDESIFKEYLQKFSLSEKRPIRNFSKGMKRQVFVALALAVKPKYLLLDEAFDGLDPLARMFFKKGLVDLVEKNGTTVIISSHSLRELEDVCDSYGILDQGTITSYGTLEEDLQKVHKFQAAFHGEVSPETLGISCLSFEQIGKVVRLMARGSKEELLQKLEANSPIFVEEIDVDFEEFFIGEVESRGYLR